MSDNVQLTNLPESIELRRKELKTLSKDDLTVIGKKANTLINFYLRKTGTKEIFSPDSQIKDPTEVTANFFSGHVAANEAHYIFKNDVSSFLDNEKIPDPAQDLNNNEAKAYLAKAGVLIDRGNSLREETRKMYFSTMKSFYNFIDPEEVFIRKNFNGFLRLLEPKSPDSKQKKVIAPASLTHGNGR